MCVHEYVRMRCVYGGGVHVYGVCVCVCVCVRYVYVWMCV